MEAKLIDLAAFVQPISEEAPGGDERAYTSEIRDQIVDLRREERAEDFDDAMRPADLKTADWNKVVDVAEEALLNQTKDIRIVCHLIEGLTKTDGLLGLRDGFALFYEMIDKCWENINPPIDPEDEEDDLDARGGMITNMLNDATHGAFFPMTVAAIPIIGPPDKAIGLTEYRERLKENGPDDRQNLADFADKTPQETLENNLSDANETLEIIKQLNPLCDEKFGSFAPGFLLVANVVNDWKTWLTGQLKKVTDSDAAADAEGDGDEVVEDGAATESGSGGATGGSAAGSQQAAAKGRAWAYRQLKEAANLLEKLEPHSPIPYIVRKAVRLGNLPFPELMRQMVRDDSARQQIEIEYGVEEDSEK